MPKLNPYKRGAYEQAIAFRKRGFTYSEIAKICAVSPSTLSAWFKHESFSKDVAAENTRKAVVANTKRLALVNKARNAERKTRYAEAVKTAETEFKHYKKDPLFMAGLMLYIGEGDNQHPRLIRIANAKPDVHRIFIRFCYTYLGVTREQIHFWLLLYPDHQEIQAMKHWCKKVGLSPAQFYKNQVIQGRSTKRTLQFGVGNTIIGSTVLKHKLNRWIELVLKEL